MGHLDLLHVPQLPRHPHPQGWLPHRWVLRSAIHLVHISRVFQDQLRAGFAAFLQTGQRTRRRTSSSGTSGLSPCASSCASTMHYSLRLMHWEGSIQISRFIFVLIFHLHCSTSSQPHLIRIQIFQINFKEANGIFLDHDFGKTFFLQKM